MYKQKVKQQYFNYLQWEDFQNGMWRKLNKEDEKEFLQIAVNFTGDHILYGNAMLRAITEWPVTCLQNLTNLDINHRAFIGHCACCIEHKIPEYIVRQAWWKLNDKQRELADQKASEAIKKWQDNYYIKQTIKTNAKNQIRIDGL